MKNRAKCKLCNDVLESFHEFDYVTCKCGEISISGGSIRLECSAKDWKNFVRIDDQGNEISVKVLQQGEVNEQKDEESQDMTRDEKIEMLETMVKNIESLPKAALLASINHYDLYSYLILVVSILKSESK
jgi:hypothetical protein